MKISNQKFANLKVQILYAFLLTLVFALICMVIFRYIFDIKVSHFIFVIAITIFLIALLRFLGKPFFFYDSDGETLNVHNKSFSFLPNNYKTINKAEFPKGKLESYKIKSFLIYKRLELYLHSKKAQHHTAKLKYDISYLSSEELKNLKISLNKMVKENSQNPLQTDE